ncbi:hypothetical protein TanjilG_16486 [Lupinus angustifolius]|uniref:Uncharacterized protein n=1 Tax=Lupinus angustifolius TaxID=3871 RepID=A0A1J7IEQ2_LUPAN|nr:PREDICTED: indole-3-acetic acid-induced protein ARG2-like [Lupinus angustifolius]OIW13377.1 hypothetical protein TanjilG_16486 [Lupinus angustifolius]
MARFFSNAKLLSALVLDGFSSSLTRRGYGAATATQSATKGGIGSLSNKMAPKSGEGSNKVSWVPDPVTGYYKPENIKEIDVAELRATLLDKKFNNN